MLGAAFFNEVLVKIRIIGLAGVLDDGVVGLVSLNETGGFGNVSAADAADDLGEEVEGAFFGGVVGEGEASVGLDDADGGETGKIEAFGDGLGADDEVDFAGFDSVIFSVESVIFSIIGIKTGDFGGGEEFLKLFGE